MIEAGVCAVRVFFSDEEFRSNDERHIVHAVYEAICLSNIAKFDD